MEREQQERYHALGRDYWWLAGKYRIVLDVLERAFRDPAGRPAQVLDMGCGPGNLLDGLGRRWPACIGADYSEDALRFCRSRGHLRVFRADFQALPLRSESVDLITSIDVLEHLEDDRPAFAEIARVLRPGGRVLISVPAFQFLWGEHDTLYGHHRRYRVPQVRERLERVGLEVERATYFEPLWMLPLLLYRNLKKAVARGARLDERDDFVPLFAPLNTLLREAVAAERFVLRYTDLPFGVTLLALARKPA